MWNIKSLLFLSTTLAMISFVECSLWTWASGGNATSQVGYYGDKGKSEWNTIPGGRSDMVGWIDSNNTLYLCCGYGIDSGGRIGLLNDLWKFDLQSQRWTWISGSPIRNEATNGESFGGRHGAGGWNFQNAFWLFGGYGVSSTRNIGYLNDLWKYESNSWRLVGGDSSNTNRVGIYSGNSAWPGGRSFFAYFSNANKFYLYGGKGFGTDSASEVKLNDLWKYEDGMWTCLWGDGTNQVGSYRRDYNAYPGSRFSSSGWVDKDDNVYIYGGYGLDEDGEAGLLNDLWKFNTATKTWTWINGGPKRNQPTSENDTKWPRSLSNPVLWNTLNYTSWLFGGLGFDSPANGLLRDIWSFKEQDATWTHIMGDDATNEKGSYDIKDEFPGSRRNPVGWITNDYELFLFGGYGYDGFGNIGLLNDMWAFQSSFVRNESGPPISTTGSIATTTGSIAITTGSQTSGGVSGTATTTSTSTTTATTNTTTSTTTTSQTIDVNPNKRPHLPDNGLDSPALIIGITVVAVVIFLATLGIILFIYLRARSSSRTTYQHVSGDTNRDRRSLDQVELNNGTFTILEEDDAEIPAGL